MAAIRHLAFACLVAVACAAWAADGPPAAATAPGPGVAFHPKAAWRGARWEMTVGEVLKAFPGEAARLDPEEKLADGNVVAAGIERHLLHGQEFRVRFVFEGGKLALVSLRTPLKKYASPEVYAQMRKHLAGDLGGPGEETKDDNFIDMRQVRWEVAGSRVDLKYIPGTLVVLYSPLPASTAAK